MHRILSLTVPSVGLCCVLTACALVNPQRQPTWSAETRIQVAEAAAASGDSELAISMYYAAAESAPDNVGLQLRCADALARRGKIAEARELLSKRLQTNPGQPDLTRALALIDLVAGRLTQAIAELDQILETNPGDERAQVDKAVALDLQGHHAAAQVIYRQVLSQYPDDAATRNNLALSLMLQGRARQALETLAPMRDADASPQRLRTNLGILYAAMGNQDQSRQLLGGRISEGDLAALTRALATDTSSY